MGFFKVPMILSVSFIALALCGGLAFALDEASPLGNVAKKQRHPHHSLPEPATVLLVGSGVAGLAYLRRKNSRKDSE